MIAVDTSVWIAAFRNGRSAEATALRELVDSDDVLLPIPVKIELLAGASKRDRGGLRLNLSALPVAYPTDDTWRLMDGWTDITARAGQTFGLGDLLIAAIAREAGALIWSLDAAFDRLERLRLASRYQP